MHSFAPHMETGGLTKPRRSRACSDDYSTRISTIYRCCAYLCEEGHEGRQWPAVIFLELRTVRQTLERAENEDTYEQDARSSISELLKATDRKLAG